MGGWAALPETLVRAILVFNLKKKKSGTLPLPLYLLLGISV